MKIETVGYDFRHDRRFMLTRANGLKEYLFLIIRSSAIFRINGKTLSVKPNSMILIAKNTPHSFSADSELFINDWLAFDLTDQEYSAYLEHRVQLNTFFTSPDVFVCSDLIRLMQAEKTSASIFKNGNMLSLLQIIFNKLHENSQHCSLELTYYNEFQAIRDHIYQHPSEKYTIESLAREVKLSRSYFQHCYRSYFHTTPISDVIHSRILYAKQLLLSTNYSVSRIAELVGYPNDISFLKQFKAVTSMTPTQYRSSKQI